MAANDEGPILAFSLTDEEKRRFKDKPVGQDLALDDLRMEKMRDLTRALEASLKALTGDAVRAPADQAACVR